MIDLSSLADGALCPGCDTIKTLNHFTRFLTGAEARYQGYAGNVRVKVETKLCRACQPKRKPLSHRRAGELRQMVESGDIDLMTAEHIQKKRLSRAWMSRQVKGVQQAARRWEADLKVLLLGPAEKHPKTGAVRRMRGVDDPPSMAKHVHQVDSWLRYRANQQMRGKDPGATTTPLYQFMVAYLKALKREMERIKSAQMFNPAKVTATRWEELVDRNLWFELRRKWNNLTPEDRRGLVRVTPDLVMYTPDESQ